MGGKDKRQLPIEFISMIDINWVICGEILLDYAIFVFVLLVYLWKIYIWSNKIRINQFRWATCPDLSRPCRGVSTLGVMTNLLRVGTFTWWLFCSKQKIISQRHKQAFQAKIIICFYKYTSHSFSYFPIIITNHIEYLHV